MKKLTKWLLQYQLKKAIKSAENETHDLMKRAKEDRVKYFKSALLFL